MGLTNEKKLKMNVTNRIAIENKHVYGNIESKRLPLLCGIELTFNCNLKCVHCYIKSDSGREEISSSDICNILTEISKLRSLWLVLTGGEPLLREDFIDIYVHAKEKGFLIVIFSNGTLITEKIVRCFRKLPPYLIELTTYGFTKDTYERVTRVKGSYEMYKQGLELLLKNKIKFRLRTLGMKINKNEIWEIKKFAKKIGVDFGYYLTLRPQFNQEEPPEVALLPREIAEMGFIDKQMWKDNIKKFMNKDYSSYACDMALVSFLINPYGELDVRRMAPCFPYNYDLKAKKFKECWYDFMSKFNFYRKKQNAFAKIVKYHFCVIKLLHWQN